MDFDVQGIPEDIYGPFDDLYETVTFSDSTAVSGDISTFSKSMGYTSVIDVSGDFLNIRMARRGRFDLKRGQFSFFICRFGKKKFKLPGPSRWGRQIRLRHCR